MKKDKSNIAQYHLHKAHPEKLQFEMYCLNAYRNKNAEKAATPHSHSYYQIIWFFEGSGTHEVDFKSHEIKDDTVLFITKDQIHAFDDDLSIQGRLIHFNESFFMHSDVDTFLKYTLFNAEQNPCYSIDSETKEVARSYVSLIQAELDNRNRFAQEDVLRFLLKSFLINLERIHQEGTEIELELHNPYKLKFFRFKELVESNFAKGFSVGNYADLLHVSSKTLTTITKSVVSKSPAQIITERVILEAKRLLRFTTLQISEVAFRLGFEDDSYFIKYFKRNVGSSPGHYRNFKK